MNDSPIIHADALVYTTHKSVIPIRSTTMKSTKPYLNLFLLVLMPLQIVLPRDSAETTFRKGDTMKRMAVLFIVVIMLLTSANPVEAGNRLRNAVIGFVIGASTTYLVMSATNPMETQTLHNLWAYELTTSYKTKKYEGSELRLFAAGGGIILGGIACALTPPSRTNAVLRFDGKTPKLQFPAFQIQQAPEGRKLCVKLLSITQAK
jgi:hypothetical protein